MLKYMAQMLSALRAPEDGDQGAPSLNTRRKWKNDFEIWKNLGFKSSFAIFYLYDPEAIINLSEPLCAQLENRHYSTYLT